MKGRVIAVTGGARGIGLAIAREAHLAGARVAIGDLDASAVAEAALALGEDVLGCPLDVTNRDVFAAFLAQVEAQLGPIDVLVNNAGIMPIGPIVEEPDSTTQRTLDVNVRGVILGTKLALATMLPRAQGHIVNIASVAGKGAVAGHATYAASKFAVVGFTEAARAEHAERGILFTCVMPSFTNTDLIAGTRGTRGLRTVEAPEVATAVVRAIERGATDVYVPRVAGPIVALLALLPRAVRGCFARWMGADTVFLEFDQEARRAYVERIESRSAER